MVCAFFACARERVEVAEVEAPDAAADAPMTATGDGDPPQFPIVDGGLDVEPSCGPPPTIGKCGQPCPTGYKPLADGAPTCDCCP